MIAGVAEGLSRHLDIDPILVRVVLGALTLFGGAGIALYVIAWMTVPVEGASDSGLSRLLRRDPHRVMVVGLSVAAVVAAITMVGAIGASAPNPVPLTVVGILAIAAVAIFSRRSERAADTSAPPPGDTDDATASVPGAPPPSRGPRSHLFAVSAAVSAIAIAVLWIVQETVAPDLSPSAYPASVLAVIAVALIVGAWFGRSRGLIVAGFLASIVTLISTVAGPGPYGERVYQPTSAAAVSDSYEHGVGRIAVHLEDVTDIAALDTRTIDLASRVGQIEIVVPTSIDATISAHVDHGEITGLSGVRKGADGAQDVAVAASDDDDPDVRIDLDLRFGQIVIRQVDCPIPDGAQRPQGIPTIYQIGDSDAAACN